MKKALDKIISYAMNLTDPEEIILFGSVAKGRSNIYSDLDLLIISNQVNRKKETENRLVSYIKEFSLKSDILIHTEAEKLKALNEPLSFLGSIIREGKIIYKRVAS